LAHFILRFLRLIAKTVINKSVRRGLLRLFCPLMLTETAPWATAVLVDELDACGFERALKDVEYRATRLTGNMQDQIAVKR
jgi:hypothetical protein